MDTPGGDGRDRVAAIGRFLTALGDDDGAYDELTGALEREDAEAFGGVLDRLGFGGASPPVECAQICQTFVLLRGEGRFEERCSWVGRARLDASGAAKVREAAEADAAALLEALKRLGLIQCEWVWVPPKGGAVDVQRCQKVCPGSEPTPGPDPRGQP